ncbi:MAG: hypothetical protein ACE5I3_02295 [Phycisphaerae bacterium]
MTARCLTLGLATLVLLLASAACQPASQPAEAAQKPADKQPVEWRGMAIQLRHGPGALETYLPLIREVAELGANTLLLSVAGYMEHARSQAIYIDARHAPSRKELMTLIRAARRHGLRTILMPIVLLKHPRGSEWRGVIDPPSWDRWWKDYRDFIKYFADIAREAEAEALTVGSELVSSEKHTAEWVTTIYTARAHFPKGKLGYSANWDHFRPVKFWHLLDFIGMTSYYTLGDKKNPSVAEIVARWRPVYKEIMDWRHEVGKPLLLTEVGWCSQEGAAMSPWNYYQNMKATPAGLEEQRRLYEAFLQVWDGSPGLLGMIWWEWTPAPGGPGDFDYTPRNKPAEQVLRRWFAEGKPTSRKVDASP